jgi:hypothetical protein
LKERVGEINTDLQSKISDLSKNVIDKGLNVVDQKLGEYKVVGFAMYAIPVILLLYIIYLLNKYH